MKPEPPFTLGVDVAGTVVSGPGFEPGQRVVGVLPYGGASERATVPACRCSRCPTASRSSRAPPSAQLPDRPLRPRRARRAREGETVLVHGAAGGVGTATIQVAGASAHGCWRSSRPRTKADLVRSLGADDVVPLDGFRDAVTEPHRGTRCRRRRRRGRRAGVHRLAARARASGPVDGRRLRLRPGHPGGQGQPAAAEQRRRPRGGLGCLRAGPAGYMQEQWADFCCR